MKPLTKGSEIMFGSHNVQGSCQEFRNDSAAFEVWWINCRSQNRPMTATLGKNLPHSGVYRNQASSTHISIHIFSSSVVT